MSDFEIAVVSIFIGWLVGITTYALLESFRILKEIRARR